MQLHVAVAQIPVRRDIRANSEAILRGVEFAAREGAGILLTPEGSLSGYTHEFDAGTVSEALAEVTSRAAGARLGLALGTCFVEPDDGRCYNQVRFYDRDGRCLGFHPKTLNCGTLEDFPRGEINHYAVRPLRTFSFHGITVGGLICNDMWANPECTPVPDPHLSQQLARMGARVIFHAVNGGRDGSEWSAVAARYHEANLRLRARAGAVWIVTVDSCEPTSLVTSSPGGVLSPDGCWAAELPRRGEQFLAHTIEIG